MDKWFDNKDKTYRIKYHETDLNNYEPEYNPKRNMGLIWCFIFIIFTIFLVIMVYSGYEVAFIVIPFPLWLAWQSWKIYRNRF